MLIVQKLVVKGIFEFNKIFCQNIYPTARFGAGDWRNDGVSKPYEHSKY